MLKSTLKLIITNILGLSVLSLIVNMSLPDGSFKKYAKFMINIVMLATILKSFLNMNDALLLDESLMGNYVWRGEEMLNTGDQSLAEVQKEQIEQLFKKKVENQIKMQIEKMTEWKNPTVVVGIENTNGDTYNITNIQIKLDSTSSGDGNIKVGAKQNENKLNDVANYLSGLYSVPKENISIEIFS